MKSQWFHPFTQRSILTERVKIDVSPRGALMVLAGFHKGLIDMLVKIVVVKRGILLAGSIRTTFLVCGRSCVRDELEPSMLCQTAERSGLIQTQLCVFYCLCLATHTSHCNVLD